MAVTEYVYSVDLGISDQAAVRILNSKVMHVNFLLSILKRVRQDDLIAALSGSSLGRLRDSDLSPQRLGQLWLGAQSCSSKARASLSRLVRQSLCNAATDAT